MNLETKGNTARSVCLPMSTASRASKIKSVINSVVKSVINSVINSVIVGDFAIQMRNGYIYSSKALAFG